MPLLNVITIGSAYLSFNIISVVIIVLLIAHTDINRGNAILFLFGLDLLCLGIIIASMFY